LGETLAALSPGLPALLDGRVGADALAAAPKLAAAPAILRLALTSGASALAAAEAWEAVARRFHLPALRAAANMARVSGSFGNRARAALLADITAAQARLAAANLAGQPEAPSTEMAARLVEEAASVPDLAAVTVAARALAALA
jgi:glutamate dehydrogenase